MQQLSNKSKSMIHLFNKHFNKKYLERVNFKEKEEKVEIKNDCFKYSKFDEYIKSEENKEKIENDDFSNHTCSKDHRKEIEIYEKSNFDKLKITEEFKDKGNQFFLKNDFEKSNFFYQRGLIYLSYTIPKDKNEQSKFDELTVKLNSNISLIELKNKNYTSSLDYIYQVLRINKDNLKCLYRKCKIYFEMDEFEKCKKSLDNLFSIYPSNIDGLALLNDLNSKIKKFKTKEKEILRDYLKT